MRGSESRWPDSIHRRRARPVNAEKQTPGLSLDASLCSLDSIIETCRADRSVIGVFPAMYRAVTASIQQGLQTGFFEDAEMLEVLAVTFADRYLVAYDQIRDGIRPTPEEISRLREAVRRGGRRNRPTTRSGPA